MKKEYLWYQPQEVLEGLDFKNNQYIERYKIIDDLLKNMLQKNDSLIDVGCNGGLVSLLAAKNRVKKVLGVDSNEENIKCANRCLKIWKKKGVLKKSSNVSFEFCMLTKNLDVLDEFNYIAMLRVLYHLGISAELFFKKIKDMKNITVIVQCNERHQKHIDRDAVKYSGKYGKKLFMKKNCIRMFEKYGYRCIMKIEEGMGPEPILVFTNKAQNESFLKNTGEI